MRRRLARCCVRTRVQRTPPRDAVAGWSPTGHRRRRCLPGQAAEVCTGGETTTVENQTSAGRRGTVILIPQVKFLFKKEKNRSLLR